MKKINFKKEVSILQIVILVFGIIAIGYAFGSEVKVVSAIAQGDPECQPGTHNHLDENDQCVCDPGFTFESDELGNYNCIPESPNSAGDEKCTQAGGTCSAPMSTTTGDACKTSSGVDGKVKKGLCLSPENIKKARCCIPSSATPEPTGNPKLKEGDWCSQQTGRCVLVTYPNPQGFWVKSTSNVNWWVVSPTITGQKCSLPDGTAGTYKYGECEYPDQNYDSKTPVCCVTKIAGPESDQNKIGENGVCNVAPAQGAGNGAPASGQGVCTQPGKCTGTIGTDMGADSCAAGLTCCKLNNGAQSDQNNNAAIPSFWQTVGTAGIPLFGTLLQGGSPGEEFSCKIGGKSYSGFTQCKTDAAGDATKIAACQKECKVSETGGKYLGAQLTSAAFWAAGITAILQIIKAVAKEHAGLYNSLNYGLAGGIFGGKLLAGGAGALGLESKAGLAALDIGGTLIGGAIIFLATYHEEATQKKTFESVVWQPPLGGDHCEMCNQQGALPCSEYQCRSLGMACQIINPGTAEEKCFWMNRNDVNPPQMRPWDEALPADSKYSYIDATNVNPPDKGVKIAYTSGGTNTNKCLPPYQPISFGITLDEPASCKLDYQQTGNFENMTYYFGGDSLLRYNHTQVMTLPGPEEMNGGNLTYNNGQSFSMYARCKDANGNANTADFVFQFCVDDGPDSTPPIIVATDPVSGMPVAFNVTTLNVNVYTNEKAKCKWSKHDQTYDIMNNTMTSTDAWGDKTELNGITLYKHIATLNGIESDKENKYYFRCIDNAKPVANKNTESYPYTLVGTTPLEIIAIGPNGTIKDNTDAIKVTLTAKTFGGYNEGASTCSFKQEGEDFSKYTTMFKTGGIDHSQDLQLPEGTYNYDIRCVDLGGNADVKNTTFFVDQDNEAPLVTRLYFENGYLKMNTNEKATCVYSTTDCTYYYQDGIGINAVDDTTFFTDWNVEANLYIKCKDIYGNEPYPPTSCTIVAKPYDIYIPVEENP
ncbi:Uncharacterised protein [uncultured archaeon]|nr:Uncharacterised protein [uncultured archaeon]